MSDGSFLTEVCRLLVPQLSFIAQIQALCSLTQEEEESFGYLVSTSQGCASVGKPSSQCKRGGEAKKLSESEQVIFNTTVTEPADMDPRVRVSAKEDLVAENFEQDANKQVHCMEQIIANTIRTGPCDMYTRVEVSARKALVAEDSRQDADSAVCCRDCGTIVHGISPDRDTKMETCPARDTHCSNSSKKCCQSEQDEEKIHTIGKIKYRSKEDLLNSQVVAEIRDDRDGSCCGD